MIEDRYDRVLMARAAEKCWQETLCDLVIEKLTREPSVGLDELIEALERQGAESDGFDIVNAPVLKRLRALRS